MRGALRGHLATLLRFASWRRGLLGLLCGLRGTTPRLVSCSNRSRFYRSPWKDTMRRVSTCLESQHSALAGEHQDNFTSARDHKINGILQACLIGLEDLAIMVPSGMLASPAPLTNATGGAPTCFCWRCNVCTCAALCQLCVVLGQELLKVPCRWLLL